MQFNVLSGRLLVKGKAYRLTQQDKGAGHYPDLNDSDAAILPESSQAMGSVAGNSLHDWFGWLY
ncbi:MAG: hypothetical protein H6574_17325 [Lewinellaceae bacterium]|nr:hypothetical protein [Lewinellaceae bacterium]